MSREIQNENLSLDPKEKYQERNKKIKRERIFQVGGKPYSHTKTNKKHDHHPLVAIKTIQERKKKRKGKVYFNLEENHISVNTHKKQRVDNNITTTLGQTCTG